MAEPSRVARLLGIALLLLPSPDAAAQATPPPAPSKAEHQVDFRAEHVELAPDSGALELRGGVVVRVDRFQLAGPALRLNRSARGVHVEGDGHLSFCACAKPAVAFGFQRADLAPPTDVLLENATLRWFGLPVFWSPYLWLRSKDRPGLTPPSVAYRSTEGVVLSSGLHLPSAVSGAGRSAFDLRWTAYSHGGFRLESAWGNAWGRSLLAIDYLERTGLTLQSEQASGGRDGSWFAERIDWMRGRRTLQASNSVEQVARAADRVRLGVVRARQAVFGIGFASDAPRGGPLDQLGWFGPEFALASGGAWGRSAHYGVGIGSRTAQSTLWGPLFLGNLQAEGQASLLLGPLRAALAVVEQGRLLVTRDTRAAELGSELRAHLGAPLFRRFGALLHTLEPSFEAALQFEEHSQLPAASAEDAELRGLLAELGRAPASGSVLLGRLDTALGSASAGDWEASLGLGVTGARDTAVAVAAARSRWAFRRALVAVDTRWVPSVRALDASLRWALGTLESARLALELFAATGDSGLARRIWWEDGFAPRDGWLDRSGTSGSARIGVPWGVGLDTEVGTHFDWITPRWLASFARVAYRHPCRCVSLTALGSRRVGRAGVDVGLEVSVFPR